MIYAGIDVGLSGGIAFFNDFTLLEVIDMPKKPTQWDKGNMVDSKALADALLRHRPERVNVERASAMPGQGVSSMFSFGMSYQAVFSVLEVLEIPYEVVQPKKWQKQFGVVGKTKEGIHSADVVDTIYPEANIRGRMGGLKDGRCDAILIALYDPKASVLVMPPLPSQ